MKFQISGFVKRNSRKNSRQLAFWGCTNNALEYFRKRAVEKQQNIHQEETTDLTPFIKKQTFQLA